MGVSIWQLAIIAILIIVLFGKGKISDLMGDVAKGIKSFKKGMQDDDAKVTDAKDSGTVIDAKVTNKDQV